MSKKIRKPASENVISRLELFTSLLGHELVRGVSYWSIFNPNDPQTIVSPYCLKKKLDGLVHSTCGNFSYKPTSQHVFYLHPECARSVYYDLSIYDLEGKLQEATTPAFRSEIEGQIELMKTRKENLLEKLEQVDYGSSA